VVGWGGGNPNTNPETTTKLQRNTQEYIRRHRGESCIGNRHGPVRTVGTAGSYGARVRKMSSKMGGKNVEAGTEKFRGICSR